MKKTLIIALVALLPLGMMGQLASQWQQIYGGPGVEVTYGIRSCLDQGYIAGGASSSAGPSDGYVLRLDSLGLVMWAKFYGGVNIDIIRSVELLPDSGFIMAGYTNSYGAGGYDGWLLRLDKNGDTLWTKTIGTTNWDFFYDVECTRDGGFLCAGGTYGLGNGDEDMYLVRLNSLGDTLWTRTYGGARTDEARGVVETEDSLIAICGFTESYNDTLGDSWLLRLDEIGDTIWTRTFGALNVEDHANALHYDSIADMIIYTGYTYSIGNGDAYWEGVSYSNVYWTTVFGGGSLFEEYTSVRIKPGLACILTSGTTYTYGGGLGDMYFFASNSWTYTSFGTIQEDHAYDADFTRDGGYILGGSTTGYNSFVANAYVVKVDTAFQTTAAVGIAEQAHQEVSVTAWPVPANEQININVSGCDANEVSIVITDIAGRTVGNIPAADINANANGIIHASYSTSMLMNGVYFYTVINSQGVIASNRFIISR